MADKRRSRRDFLAAGAAAGAVIAGDALLPAFLRAEIAVGAASAFPDGLPGQWPVMADDQKDLLRLPLSEAQAKALLRYKVNHYVLEQDPVLLKLRDNGYGIPFYLPAKTIMDTFYDNVLLEYKDHQKWDKHPEETAPTAGSLMRRFFEHASNHFHESDLEDKLGTLKKTYKHPPYPADAARTDPVFTRIIGEETKAKINYSNVDFNMLDAAIVFPSFNPLHPHLHFTPQIKPEYAERVALITRSRPQLDFPHLINVLTIDPKLLGITHEELTAAGVDVNGELKKLHDEDVKWAKRVKNGEPPETQKQ